MIGARPLSRLYRDWFLSVPLLLPARYLLSAYCCDAAYDVPATYVVYES